VTSSCNPTSLNAIPDLVRGAIDEWRHDLAQRGLGHRVGVGRTPALLVVDMQTGFTDPACPLGASAPSTIEAVANMLFAARETLTPVIYTVCLAAPESSVWQRKLPANAVLTSESGWVEVHPELTPAEGEPVLRKHFASAFFGTNLDERLRALGVDTLIVTGMTTSGCIRASVVDACSLGYRVLVPTEAVADRLEVSHLISLFDIDLKYGDVMPAADVIQCLRELGAARSAREFRSARVRLSVRDRPREQ
jgi:maleamate amidohydrolase